MNVVEETQACICFLLKQHRSRCYIYQCMNTNLTESVPSSCTASLKLSDSGMTLMVILLVSFFEGCGGFKVFRWIQDMRFFATC